MTKIEKIIKEVSDLREFYKKIQAIKKNERKKNTEKKRT